MTKKFHEALQFIYQKTKSEPVLRALVKTQEEDLYYTAIHEMTLLGGKWIGQRLKWAETDAGTIRLEIFHATPRAIVCKANEMLTIDNPFYKYLKLKRKTSYMIDKLVSFTLRDVNNTFIAIASFMFPTNLDNTAYIRQIIIDSKFRRVRNGSSLLLAIEDYVAKAGYSAIVTNTKNNIGTEFYIKRGFTLNITEETDVQYLYKKVQPQSQNKSPRKNFRSTFTM